MTTTTTTDIATLAATWRQAASHEETTRLALHAALRDAMRHGVSAYRLAQESGLSERHVGRIREEDDEMVDEYWTCVGGVRGECGVHHRTEETAAAHCARDDRDVKRGHGSSAYSDRRPVLRSD